MKRRRPTNTFNSKITQFFFFFLNLHTLLHYTQTGSNLFFKKDFLQNQLIEKWKKLKNITGKMKINSKNEKKRNWRIKIKTKDTEMCVTFTKISSQMRSQRQTQNAIEFISTRKREEKFSKIKFPEDECMWLSVFSRKFSVATREKPKIKLKRTRGHMPYRLLRVVHSAPPRQHITCMIESLWKKNGVRVTPRAMLWCFFGRFF